MTTTTPLTAELLLLLRQRRSAGAPLKSLADEIGLPWQRLDKAIRNGLPKHGRPRPVPPPPADLPGPSITTAVEATPTPTPADGCKLEAVTAAGSLTDRYRPRTFAGVFGQPKAVKFLRSFVSDPYSTAMLLEGETGTGKTSAALALAAELGCDLDQNEFGGVWVIASGEQTADAVRETCRNMHTTPFNGTGWKVVIVNEADRMHAQAETVWLDRLEGLPPRTVVVFTTNHAGKLSQRFLDRCTRIAFDADAGRMGKAVRGLLLQLWTAETGQASGPLDLIDRIVADSIIDGKVSFRRAIQLMTPVLALERGSAQ